MDADQRRAVDAILRHDRESSGAELVYYFVHELGVAEREAWQEVVGRPVVLPGENVSKVVAVLS